MCKEYSKGVFEVPILVSNQLLSQYEAIKQSVLNAQKHIVEFSYQHGWENLTVSSFIDHVEIFDTQNEFKEALIKNFNLDDSIELPSTVSAVLEDKVLMAVSPLVYKEIYQIEGDDPLGFERLLTHEIAHRLHVRILNGEEERMGPVWFYEGFAVYVAKQFPNITCEEQIIWDIIEHQKDVSYLYYASIFKYLTQFISIEDLVKHAGDHDFVNFLKHKVCIKR